MNKQTRGSGCRADARTVRCAPTLGEALLLTAPPSAWGTTGSYSRRLSPSPAAARLSARPRSRRDPQAQRGQETYPRSHSKQATDRARPPHSPCEVPSAHCASRSRNRDCGAMRGREQAGRAGRRRGRQLAGRLTKPPFFPRAPPSPPSPALAAPVGGSARSRDPLPSLNRFRATAARARTSEVGQGSADGSPGLAAGRAEGAGRERWRALWRRRMKS